MKKHIATFCLIIAVSGLAATTSLAGEKDIMLCLPGFPGTQTQAQPYLDKMLRYLETKLGWEQGSMTGAYLSDDEEAGKALVDKKPGIALVGPSIYAGHHKSMGMKVIAKVEANGRGESVYSVITRKDGPKSLAELKGKKLSGTILHDAQFVYNVLLDGTVEKGKIELVHEKRPLQTLRHVARGKVDAALVDDSVREHMSELPFASDLQVIYTSKPVPPPAVVVLTGGAKHAAKLGKVLVGLCDQPDGRDLCKTLTISSIKAAKDADYKPLLKRYDK